VRLDVAAGLVEGEHQVPDELLAITVRRDEALELRDDLAVVPELELGADPVLERCEPALLEMTDVGLDARLERKLGERLAAPQAERFAQRRGALGRSLATRPLLQPLEGGKVELLRARSDQV